MKVKLTTTEEILGTASNNPDLHREYIASRSGDHDKIEEEMKALTAEQAIEKAMTIFPRMPDGTPFIWDYQIKGFIKEAVGTLLEIIDTKEFTVGKTKLTKFTHKRIVDNYLFVFPRIIPIIGEKGPDCTRPLRAETMQGDRVALATSETIKAGATMTFEIRTLNPGLDALMEKCLDYGCMKGLGQWRNSGKGRFTWEKVE